MDYIDALPTSLCAPTPWVSHDAFFFFHKHRLNPVARALTEVGFPPFSILVEPETSRCLYREVSDIERFF